MSKLIKTLILIIGLFSFVEALSQEVVIVGVLDSVIITKRPYISTYVYYFTNKVDQSCFWIRHLERTAPYEVGLPGNCHLDIGEEYTISLEIANEESLSLNPSIYREVLKSREKIILDDEFEKLLNGLLSEKKKLKRLLSKKNFRSDLVDFRGSVFFISNITPCSSQLLFRSHNHH